jgi:hypothetical protein
MSLDETWRTWLMTGTRRPPIDRRRVRGAHKGLKRMLVEGMTNGGDRTHSWTRFSGAMVRQAVDDGVRMLPPDQNQLIKLAYFGGLSNAEIAQRLGTNISSVERGLKQAVAAVSEYVERGHLAGRRAVYALVVFLCGRSLTDSGHAVKAAALVAVATVLVAGPAAPSSLTPVDGGPVPAVVSSEPGPLIKTIVEPAPNAGLTTTSAPAVPVALPVASPATLPIPVRAPALPLPLPVPLPLPLPSVPALHGLLGA